MLQQATVVAVMEHGQRVDRAVQGEFAPQPIEVDQLGHGDLVIASFTQNPYGDFVVTGVITQAANDDKFLMVGPWIVQTSQGRAERLSSIELISRAGTHVAPVPGHRSAVDINDLI